MNAPGAPLRPTNPPIIIAVDVIGFGRAVALSTLAAAVTSGIAALATVVAEAPRFWPGVVIGFLAVGSATFLAVTQPPKAVRP